MNLFIELLIGITAVQCACAYTEVFKNADFEYTDVSRDWTCQGCTINTSRDSYSKYHSILVTHRTHDHDGLAQDVHVTAGERYNFTAYIKLQDVMPGYMYHTAELMMRCLATGTHRHYLKFAHVPYVRKSEWTQLGGLLHIPQGYHSCHAYVQLLHSTVDYLIDHMTLHLVPDDTNWRTEANARIDMHRKADVTISLTGADSGSYNVELLQTAHDFAFGSAVSALHITDPAYKNYQDTFYDNFEWAVLENKLKWSQMERTRGVINYDLPITALKALSGNGTKVRGHNVFWATPQHVPTWVSHLNKAELQTAMNARTTGVVGATKGLVEHWDVNNEQLHGDWYEQALGDPNVTMDMFRDVHKVDNSAKLFLNDFGVLEKNMAVPLHNQALLFKNAGVPIYGVGIQSHLKTGNPDMTALKANLDTVASAGLPIWITELTVHATDVNIRASTLSDVMTLYFSHPDVQGLLLWGFWEGKTFDVNTVLFNGPNLTPNAAGHAYQKLYKTTWRTHETRTLAAHASEKVRAFKGSYTVNVKQNGHILKSEKFQLDSTGKTINVNVGSATPDIIFG